MYVRVLGGEPSMFGIVCLGHMALRGRGIGFSCVEIKGLFFCWVCGVAFVEVQWSEELW